MAKTIRVVARIKSQPNTIDETRAVLLGLIDPTRSEAGCIRYELLQNNSDPTDFTFVEEWQSDDALNQHLASAHLAAASIKASALLAEPPDIRRYSLVK